jgi:hypothetical protein
MLQPESGKASRERRVRGKVIRSIAAILENQEEKQAIDNYLITLYHSV